MKRLVLDLLFPPKCPFCGKLLDHTGICPACAAELPWTDNRLRIGADGLLCAAPLWYEGLVQEAVLRLKFQGCLAVAEPLGPFMAQCAAECFLEAFDVVTWVPVSRKRLKKRGYDQAELLARNVCKVWRTKPKRLLVKPVDNTAQSSLKNAEARWANVHGVYAIAKGANVKGRRILLIDDVCTTGATLSSCMETLKDAGAEAVVCTTLALARFEREKSTPTVRTPQKPKEKTEEIFTK